MRHPFSRRPGGRRRWLDRRALLASVAAVAVVATAIYATSTHGATSPPTHARQVADTVGSATPGTDPLPLPFSLTDLPQQVQLTTPGGVTSTTDPFPVVNQLIQHYQINVDATAVQPFLDQTATATTPQQVTDDARTFLVQQGVPQPTIDQAMTDVATLQAQPAISWPGKGQGRGGGLTLKELIAALGLLLALAMSRAKVSATTDSQFNCGAYLNTGPWNGLPVSADAGRDEVLGLLPKATTAGYAIDSGNLTYVFHPDVGGSGQYTFNSSYQDQAVTDATNARLRWSTLLDMTGSVHAEQKMATFMRVCHIPAATFVINNNYICSGGPATCDTVLDQLLDVGQQLTVDYKVTMPGVAAADDVCPGTGPSPWRCHTYTGVALN